MWIRAAVESSRWEADYGKALAETRASDNQPLLVVLDNRAAEAEQVAPELLGAASEEKSAGTPALDAL